MTSGDTTGVQRQFDWESVPPTVAVLEAIAVLEHGTPERSGEVLDQPLNDTVDTDALDRLVRDATSVFVEFSVSNYAIQIRDDTVSITTT